MTKVGRFLFAVAILAFGVQHVIFVITGAGLGLPWTPVSRWLVWAVGLALLACGAGLIAGKQTRTAALALAVLMLLRALVVYAPKWFTAPRDPASWTSPFELLAIAGASLVLASGLSSDAPILLSTAGRILFVASLEVFAIQHVLYGAFIATLIPGWIPEHLFWAYFVCFAFFASALAIAMERLARLAAMLLAVMFLLWVVILHVPRVAHAPRSGNEWTSLFAALAMGGGSLIMAGTLESSPGKDRDADK